MIAVASLFIIVTISLLVTRIASVALTVTGLPRHLARFQSRSAFTGVGFTTHEAERVVGHPVRRRIISVLMIVGNVGIAAAVASLLITFVNAEGAAAAGTRLGIIAGGLFLLLLVANSRLFDRHFGRLVAWGLNRFTDIKIRDHAAMLRLAGEYSVAELTVEPDDWLTSRDLVGLDVPSEGVMILGVAKADGAYVGVPKGSTRLEPGDTIIAYGRDASIEDLDTRMRGTAGELAHVDAVVEQADTARVEADGDARVHTASDTADDREPSEDREARPATSRNTEE